MHYQAYNNTTTRQYDKVINFVLCYKYDAAATEDLPVAEQRARFYFLETQLLLLAIIKLTKNYMIQF